MPSRMVQLFRFLEHLILQTFHGTNVTTVTNLQYKTSGMTDWDNYDIDNPIEIKLEKQGDFVKFKADEFYAIDTNTFNQFNFTKNVSIAGPLNSLNLKASSDDINYMNLFKQCSTLIDASELILSETVTTNCYRNMFNGCTGLTKAPKLPATTLANTCYYYMFKDCTSLTAAPELPAITLANKCYQSMFAGCSSLTAAPDLPAIELAKNCYQNMFANCTLLSSVNVSFESWGSNYEFTSGWLSNVAENGIFTGPTSLITELTGADTYP